MLIGRWRLIVFHSATILTRCCIILLLNGAQFLFPLFNMPWLDNATYLCCNCCQQRYFFSWYMNKWNSGNLLCIKFNMSLGLSEKWKICFLYPSKIFALNRTKKKGVRFYNLLFYSTFFDVFLGIREYHWIPNNSRFNVRQKFSVKLKSTWIFKYRFSLTNSLDCIYDHHPMILVMKNLNIQAETDWVMTDISTLSQNCWV